jgi:hypothetical protein
VITGSVRDRNDDLPRWIAPAFLCSGFAALIYQTVWQRVLFASFGINIEAVTVVVTSFLLGLGLGSIAGGELSKDERRPVLLMFGTLELSIAAFGAVSVPLFRWTADQTAGLSSLVTGLVTFGLLLIPTLLMGATLPLLVAYAVRLSGNVGRSVGWLYFVNTAGSACAAIAAAMFIMGSFGEAGSVRLAALVNTAVGLFVLTRHRAAPR